MAIDVQDLEADFFAFSGHKITVLTVGLVSLWEGRNLRANVSDRVWGRDD